VTQPVQVGDVIQFPSGVTHRITNEGELRFAKWLVEHEKAEVVTDDAVSTEDR
jgi:quercetin dioxygenase-like cupin family protein